MAPALNFYAGENTAINDLAGSGLGFYGDAGFGATVQVGQWQGRSFICSSNGTLQGPEADNCKYLNATGVILGQSGSGIQLNRIPNYLASINVRFTNDTPVRTQNVQLRIYDRVSPTNPASGVTTAVYECTHLDTSQTATGSGGPGTPTVSGAHAFSIFTPSTTGALQLTSSPGTSGTRISGVNTTDIRHDHYLALSVSPDSVGSKLFAAYISLEYL